MGSGRALATLTSPHSPLPSRSTGPSLTVSAVRWPHGIVCLCSAPVRRAAERPEKITGSVVAHSFADVPTPWFHYQALDPGQPRAWGDPRAPTVAGR